MYPKGTNETKFAGSDEISTKIPVVETPETTKIRHSPPFFVRGVGPEPRHKTSRHDPKTPRPKIWGRQVHPKGTSDIKFAGFGPITVSFDSTSKSRNVCCKVPHMEE